MSARTLVACFSASGVTARVAQEIAAAVGADVCEIRPQQPYTAADLDWTNKKSRSSVEMNDPASRPAIAGAEVDMTKYDTIFLGFPIWWYVEPRIIDTFMEECDVLRQDAHPLRHLRRQRRGGRGAQPAKGLSAGAVEAGQALERRRRGGLGQGRHQRLKRERSCSVCDPRSTLPAPSRRSAWWRSTASWASSCRARSPSRCTPASRATRTFCARSSGSRWSRQVGGTVVRVQHRLRRRPGGVRDHTDTHRKLLEEHGWTKYFDRGPHGRGGPGPRLAHPGRQGAQGKPRRQAHPALRLHARARALQGPSRGRLRRSAEAAGHRLRLQREGKALIHSAGVSNRPL